MAKYIRSIEEVQDFLNQAKELAKSSETAIINSQIWAEGKVNKTRRYMAETGINDHDIRSVIQELSIENYCATKDDRNPNFPKEEVWEFGITKNLVDQDENLYIKLKIRVWEERYLLIMSFHPEEPIKSEHKLSFPYKEK